jgi:formylglycine-generating enzyme required for sulfatase activity
VARPRVFVAFAVAGLAAVLVPAGEAPKAVDVAVNSLGMRMVLVPAGAFRMGSPPGEPFRQEEERPRRVTLTKAFRVSSTEVTRRQWLALMPRDPGPPGGDELPVASVSWADAQEFCLKLSEKEGTRYRLPTEAEWERACRAGADLPPPGRADLEAAAWFADNSEGAAHAVGGKTPNAWGLHDLLGNVAEWTLDAYAPYPAGEEARDPEGPPEGATKAVRGGSWRGFAPALRCAARAAAAGSWQLPHVGFRVVGEVAGVK